MKTLRQFIKFGIIGISNTILSYIINVIVLYLLKPFDFKWDFIVGNIIEFILSVLWSFYWNNKYTFKLENGERRNVRSTLLRMYISYSVTGIVINNILSLMWLSVFRVNRYIAPAINIFISAPINFCLNKLWAFKKTKS